jgi:hypothetical protein
MQMKKRTGGLRIRPTVFIALAALIRTGGLRVRPATSQTSRIASIITNLKKQNTYLGRELWFTMCKNADRSVGQNYTLYVTSPKNTVVNIKTSSGLSSKKIKSIAAGEIL